MLTPMMIGRHRRARWCTARRRGRKSMRAMKAARRSLDAPLPRSPALDCLLASCATCAARCFYARHPADDRTPRPLGFCCCSKQAPRPVPCALGGLRQAMHAASASVIGLATRVRIKAPPLPWSSAPIEAIHAIAARADGGASAPSSGQGVEDARNSRFQPPFSARQRPHLNISAIAMTSARAYRWRSRLYCCHAALFEAPALNGLRFRRNKRSSTHHF